MIIDLLIQLFQAVVEFATTLRPEWEWHLPEGAATFISYVQGFNTILPVVEVFACITAYLALVVALQGWKWLIKLLDWIDGIIP